MPPHDTLTRRLERHLYGEILQNLGPITPAHCSSGAATFQLFWAQKAGVKALWLKVIPDAPGDPGRAFALTEACARQLATGLRRAADPDLSVGPGSPASGLLAAAARAVANVIQGRVIHDLGVVAELRYPRGRVPFSMFLTEAGGKVFVWIKVNVRNAVVYYRLDRSGAQSLATGLTDALHSDLVPPAEPRS
jgi:hypothetical protein